MRIIIMLSGVLIVITVLMGGLRADGNEEMLRNAMEHMLNIRPPVGAPKPKNHQFQDADETPNLYMMELYKKYLTSDSMKTRSNTIRSIIPHRGRFGGEEMLTFNLSALSGSEEIGSVELHFYKRRAISPRKSKLLHQHHHYLQGFTLVDPAHPERIGQWEVALEKRGWQVYDVSAAVRHSAPLRQLGFAFQGASKRPLSLDTVLRMDPTPFLVVFSNERSNASLATPKDLNVLPEERNDRRKRSIDDNELPEADHHYLNSNVIPQTSPGMLQGRGQRGKTGGKSGGPAAAATTTSSTLPYPKEGSTLDWPAEDKGTTAGRKRTSSSSSSSGASSSSRKGKRRNRKLPETWHYNQQQHVNDARLDVPEDAGRSLCQRRKLTVDFNEIGWGEWIISPKTFEAQYCAGRCPFPLTKELNPTNHATIQSIVHAIGGHPEVPAPCCVPDVLSSLTLLYFDDNRNVVLKNYPSMTAESCACR